jgi:MoaA/NifB/PqqE/SkfB family radical SAM enzyme
MSSGVQAPEFYRRLILAGLNELRISLDTPTPETGEILTQRPRAWHQTQKTLLALSDFKQEGLSFYLIINAVIAPVNRAQIPEFLDLLQKTCQPDDIKLITEVDSKENLAHLPEYPQVQAGIQAFLMAHPPEAFPLLRRKAETVFASDSIGLEEIQSDKPWRCYIPLTERTVDSTAYYPCSVYLREGGQPLGKLQENATLQREKTVSFVKDHACLEDPICRKYCLNCTRSYNHRANLHAD